MITKAVHKTDSAAAESILRNGFDLRKFGSSTTKSGPSYSGHPKGIYLTADEGFRPEDPVSHPWNHQDLGVLIFCTVVLENPFLVKQRIEGKFYQQWLADKYGATGSNLTRLIKKEGYDGIFCNETGEIVVFNPNQIKIDEEKTIQSLNSYRNPVGFKEWLKA